MFAELKMTLSERGDVAQETDVVAIEADVVDVIEEANRYVVSVRFTGQIREDKGPTKPSTRSGIWSSRAAERAGGSWPAFNSSNSSRAARVIASGASGQRSLPLPPAGLTPFFFPDCADGSPSHRILAKRRTSPNLAKSA